MPRQRWDSFAGFRLEDPTYTPKKAPPRATSAPRRPAVTVATGQQAAQRFSTAAALGRREFGRDTSTSV